MKTIKKFIKIVIVFVLVFGLLTAGIDFFRMKKGLVPVFNRIEYNMRTKIQTYKGLFYTATRKVLISPMEPLEESSKLHFKLFLFEMNIPSTWKEKKAASSLKVKPVVNCNEPSVLYYADKDIKVYTYCIDEIKIEKGKKEQDLLSYLKKDSSILDDIFHQLSFGGVLSDSTTQYYTNMDHFYSDDVSVYQCHRDFVTDVYFAPKDSTFQMDFCTYKDDDFKFMFEILDETPSELENNYQDLKKKKEEAEKKTDNNDETTENIEEITLPDPEIIFEDEKYRYEFPYPKSQYVFITTPAVRGKEETKTSLVTVIQDQLLSMDELMDKGLDITKVEKPA